MILARRFRVAPLLLTLLLTTGPLAAATYEHRPREARQARLSVTGFLSEAWTLLSRIWEKAGSGIDPFGNPTPNTQPPPNGISSESQPSGK